MSQNNNASQGFSHEKIETNNFLMIVLIVLVIAVGGLVEIVPLFFQKFARSALRRCAMATTPLLANSSMTIPSSGAASAPGPICTVWAASTATSGIVFT